MRRSELVHQLIFLAIVFLVMLGIALTDASGQTIRGVDEAKAGDLVTLTVTDADEARWVWNLNYPERFEQYATENGKLFLAMPPNTVSFSLLIIPNDTGEPIRTVRHTITPLGGDAPPTNPPVPPGGGNPPEPDPGIPDGAKDSPLFDIVSEQYAAVNDPDKAKWAKQMAACFRYVLQGIADDSYPTISDMMADVQAGNNGQLDIPGVDPWPAESRKRWLGFRDAVGAGLEALAAAGGLDSVEDYTIHWWAIVAALERGVE